MPSSLVSLSHSSHESTQFVSRPPPRWLKHPQPGPRWLSGSAAGRTPRQCQRIKIHLNRTHMLKPRPLHSIYESLTSILFILPLREPHQPNALLCVLSVADSISLASYLGADFKEVVKNPIIEYKQANLTVACTSSLIRARSL